MHTFLLYTGCFVPWGEGLVANEEQLVSPFFVDGMYVVSFASSQDDESEGGDGAVAGCLD